MAEQDILRQYQSATQTKEERTYPELLNAVMDAGWLPVHSDYTGSGAVVTFEPLNVAGSTATGTRTAAGRDEDDALRNFLAELGEQDDRTESDLYHEVLMADWNIGKTARHSFGVTLTFRYKYTSDFPGMVTREVSGTDRADAMRKFLAQLKEERASELVSASGD